MGHIKEKVAYLQGLTQGLNVNSHSAEGKLLLNIVDVLDDMAEEFNNMNMAHEDLEEYVETIDEDLTDLEEEVYEEVELTDDDYVEVQCPACHEAVSFESDVLEEADDVEVTCPYCGEIVYDNTLEITDVDEDYEDNYSRDIHPGI